MDTLSDVPLAAGAIVAGYRVESLLGTGGMGAVYAAVHPVIGKRAALKVIQAHAASPTGIERFIQEARLVNQIRHPGIVDVFGFDALPDGRPVLVMELLEGETLAAMLLRRGRLPAEEAIPLMLPAMAAIAAAHAAGVVHRDLKPENLFVTRASSGAASSIKVLDFGIAKLVDVAPGSGITSASGGYLGTPKYMSPEQCRAEPVDGRTDVYALGLILYEILAGRFPFPASSAAEFFGQHLYAAPTPLATYVQVPGRLDALVMAMLAKVRDDRPASVAALETELRALLGAMTANATIAAPSGAPPPVPIATSRPAVVAAQSLAELARQPTLASGAPEPFPVRTVTAASGLIAAPLPRPEPTPTLDENRLCTVVHAGLVVPTIERLTPEDLKELVDGAFAALGAIVERHGGTIDRLVGDAVIALFGVPRSHEDDAARAVRAALEMQQAVARTTVRGRRGATLRAKLGVRIGVASGVVFAGSVAGGAHRAMTVTGDVVTVAALLQAHAPDGALVVAPGTLRLLGGAFVTEALAPIVVRDRPEPLVGHRVSGVQLGAAGGETLDPSASRLLGRSGELERLADALDLATVERRARLLLVVGAAGVGKTRLREEAHRLLAARDDRPFLLSARASPMQQHESYALLSALLRARFDVRAEDGREVVERKLHDGVRLALRAAGAPRSIDGGGGHDPSASIAMASRRSSAELDPMRLADDVRTLAALLDARTTRSLTAAGDSVEDVGAHAAAAFARVLGAIAARAPVVLSCDGLEVADDASLDLLESLLLRLEPAPMFVLATARPELFARRPAWEQARGAFERLPLAPLSRRAMEELARAQLRRVPSLGAELVRALVDRAEGNPLVLRETIAVLLDDAGVDRSAPTWALDEARLAAIELPPTIHGLFQARLDRVPADARAVLQSAAVIGRAFWEGALDACSSPSSSSSGSSSGARSTAALLESLRAGDWLRARDGSSLPGEREWLFRETVAREVCYQSLGARAREQRHLAVARWLQSKGAVGDAQAALLALHFDRAEAPEQAFAHYVRAGSRAAALGQNADALRLLGRAVELADAARDLALSEPREPGAHDVRVADAAARVQLHLAVGDTLRRVGRLDEAEAAYERARDAIVRTERRRDVVVDPRAADRFEGSVELRLGLVEKTRGAQAIALVHYKTARQCLGDDGDPRLLAPLCAALGLAQHRTGDSAAGLRTLVEGLRAVRRIPRDELDFADAVGRVLQNFGAIFFEQGKLVRAERMYRQAGRAVDERRFPQLASMALNNVGVVHFQRGDYAGAHALFLRSLELKERVGDLYDLAVAYDNLADVELMLGDAGSALENVRTSLRLAEAMRAGDVLPDALRVLAEALAATGDGRGALLAAEQAFDRAADPAGRAYLGVCAQLLARLVGAARTGSDSALRTLADALRARVAPTVARRLAASQLAEVRAEVERALG